LIFNEWVIVRYVKSNKLFWGICSNLAYFYGLFTGYSLRKFWWNSRNKLNDLHTYTYVNLFSSIINISFLNQFLDEQTHWSPSLINISFNVILRVTQWRWVYNVNIFMKRNTLIEWWSYQNNFGIRLNLW